MASAPEEGAKEKSSAAETITDEVYEFSAPRFYDFVKGESDEDRRQAELWFDTALAYAPSPFMPRIKTGRSFTVESLCDFSEADQITKETSDSSSESKVADPLEIKPQSVVVPAEVKQQQVIPVEPEQEEKATVVSADSTSNKENCMSNKEKESKSATAVLSEDPRPESNCDKEDEKSSIQVVIETCTPVQSNPETNTKRHQSAKKIASLVRNPSALKPRSQLQSKNTKTPSSKSQLSAKNSAATPSVALENQAIKRQKLEGGKSRQILSVKPQALPHKSKLGLMRSTSTFYSSSSTANKTRIEDRKIYVREPVASTPFVSTAELMKKFQSNTRDLSLPHSTTGLVKPKLTLTRPKEPEFETAQRARSVKLKSTDELEAEMMANIPKFKARPVNKKIFESPSLPPIPRSTPHPPEFKEFRFETMARANHNAETASVTSTEVSHQSKQWKAHNLCEPKSPLLHTSLRARPNVVKSSLELQQEELEKVPKFKARPLNKKIFESKGELGIFCNVKKQVTVPQEFHFATNERLPPLPSSSVADLFDKMSLNSESRYEPLPRITAPNPFHLHTEERGAEKERRFLTEVVKKQWEEERARVPKANPYPYTTDYPVIPPKPEPKICTRPEPFQLESLMRHEEEMQRELEERQRREKLEAEMRIFKAQPILKEDPMPVPERPRKPLTQVQEFSLHADHRASDRAEFDYKIKEKEIVYKRYREEMDAERMVEEEKALKQLRRTMVPHARPVPNFNHPFCPHRSQKEITKAKTPNLRVLQRKEKRRMIANSAAAANMR